MIICVNASSKIYIIIWNLLFLIFILRLSPYVVSILLGGIISVFGMFDGTDLAKYSYYLDELYKLTYAIPYRGVFYFVIGWFFILSLIHISEPTRPY